MNQEQEPEYTEQEPEMETAPTPVELTAVNVSVMQLYRLLNNLTLAWLLWLLTWAVPILVLCGAFMVFVRVVSR